ncbi:MAG: ribulose-phosphate 3-epimerase [Clostridiales bacterium]|nr:ribulose-phosphate 3-epimerase [Clostridiales bacterium]
MDYQLCPSILAADFNRLGEQIRCLEEEGIKYLHIDVMDGFFVPSISFGMPVIRSIRKESGLFFDVHLMVAAPERYIQEFVDCGADSITVHVEACENPVQVLKQIHALGVRAGVSVKPSTPIKEIASLLGEADMVLVMTVEPGFGGQTYMNSCTEKIRELRGLIEKDRRPVDIQVDGGMTDDTLGTVLAAGANLIVAGSWVFHGEVRANVKHITERIQEFVSSEGGREWMQ